MSLNNGKISELQNMLRYIGRYNEGASKVYVTGEYDDATRSAATASQKRYGLAPNGVVDLETWNAITAEYRELLGNKAEAERVGFFPSDPGYSVRRGEASDLVAVIQIILNALSQYYDGMGSIKASGIYDSDTERAVREIQRAARMPISGYVDKDTWNSLVLEYNSMNKNNE